MTIIAWILFPKEVGWLLKGQFNKIFDLQLFSSLESAGATDQRVKIVLSLVKFSPNYSSVSVSPWVMVLRRVNIPRVSYPSESDDFYRSYLQGQSYEIFDLFLIIQACLDHLERGWNIFDFG